jgi:hypothetical protein
MIQVSGISSEAQFMFLWIAGGAMNRVGVVFCWILSVVFTANAADLSTAPSQELQALYQQLRAIQGGGQAASAENVVFKRDSATFTFLNGRIVFAEPVAGQVLAAHFRVRVHSNSNLHLLLISASLRGSPGIPNLLIRFVKRFSFFPTTPTPK